MKIFTDKEKKERKTTVKSYSTRVNYSDKSMKITIEDAIVFEENDKEILADEVVIKTMLDEITKAVIKNRSKYNDIPTKITISHDDSSRDKNKDALTKNSENNKIEVVNSYKPKYKFEDVCINKKVRNQINTTLGIIKNKEVLYNEWGLGDGYFSNRSVVLNFYGQPGTGKSMAAEAIADYLGKNVCLVNYAELESKFVGETPKNIKSAFNLAKKENAVLVFDEADSFLGKRLTSVTQSADYGVNITRSVLLLELEKFDGIVIFTTNLLSNYDDAFKRRILANIMFDLPDTNTRKDIWRVHLNKKVPLSEDITFELLANRYENVTGADIKDLILYAATNALEKNNRKISFEEFDYAYSIIKERYKNKMSINNIDGLKVTDEIITEEQYESELNKV